MKKINKFIIGFFALLIATLIILLFALLKIDDIWETTEKGITIGWMLTIIFRISIYGVPAIVIFIFNKIFCEKKYRLDEYFKIQFIFYTIIKIAWDLFALDFLFGITILNYLDTSVIVVSLFLTLIYDKKIEIKSQFELK